MVNSIILQNIDSDGLKNLIGEVISEKLQTLIPKPQPKDKHLTRSETAKELRVSLPTLNLLTKTGKIKGYRIGGRVLYKESEIEAALKQIVTTKYRR